MNNLELKQQLSEKDLAVLQSEFEKSKKSAMIAYVLWFFTGTVGGHRYYLGNIKMGIAMTLTLAGCGIWGLIDVFFINKRLQAVNEAIEKDILEKIVANQTSH